jgi:antitoxin (DNA-binding transcriptional repressor) of toxin-antitoxin stability system
MDRTRAIARIVPIAGRTRRVALRPAVRPFASIRDRSYAPLPVPIDLDALLREERSDRG